MNNRSWCGVVALFFLAICGLHAQDGTGFALSVDPALCVPMSGTASTDRYTIGGTVCLNGTYIPPALPLLRFGGALDYALLPHQSGENMQVAALGARAGLRLPLLANLSIFGDLSGGYSASQYASTLGGNPYAKGNLGVELYLTPSIKLGSSFGYLPFFIGGTSVQGWTAALSAGINFSQMNRRSKIEIQNIILFPVFPVFYKYYDSNPIGSVRFRNGEASTIQNVTVSLFIKQYMDSPKICTVINELGRGKEVEIPLYALFNRSVLSILEATKSQVEISISYTLASSTQKSTQTASATINHRNAMTWDDDRRAASFVTMNDPEILRFSRQVAGMVRASGWQGIDIPFRQAVGLIETLGLYGINYVVDPNTPFTDFSANKSAIDYLQFPIQTMDFRSGDCDDLSILTCSVLEAGGIETAFITVPGHIYTAFRIDMDQREALSFFAYPDDLIFQDGRVWIPIEATALSSGFLRAWQLGARQWKENAAKKQAVLLPIHEAWRLYEPVAMATSDVKVAVPASSAIDQRYQATMQKFTERDLGPREKELSARIAANRNDAKLQNRLGVLYARFGQFDKAEQSFKTALSLNRDASTYLNLGNVYYMKADYKTALTTYLNAYQISKNNISVLVSLVRISYEVDDRAKAEAYLGELAALDHEKASRLTSGIAAGQRASSSEPSLVWEE